MLDPSKLAICVTSEHTPKHMRHRRVLHGHISWPVSWDLFCLPKFQFITFNQESCSSMLPILYMGSITLLFWPRHFEFKALLSSSSAFFKKPFFLYQPIKPAVRAESAHWIEEPRFLLSTNFQVLPRRLLGFYKFRRDLHSRDLC